MTELLAERTASVNDLSDYGSELSSLTGCKKLVLEAAELSRWLDTLRRNAHHKTTAISVALQQAAFHVSSLSLSCSVD